MRRSDVPSICALALALVACGESFTADDTSGSSTTTVASTGDGVTASSNASATGSGGVGTGGAAPLSTPMFSEGSRLKASYVDMGDGAVSLLSFFDTELGEACSFTRFEGGVVCAPDAPLIVGGYFSDALCQEPLASGSVADGCDPPRHARRMTDQASCETPSLIGLPSAQRYASIHPITSRLDGDRPTYKIVSGECVPSPPPEGVSVYTVGPAVPLATYVSAEVAREPRGSGPLSIEVFEGSDGSRRIGQSFSADLPCRTRSVAGTQVCVPIYGGAINATLFFEDAACSAQYETPFALSTANLCAPPQYILDREYDQDNCLVSELFRTPGSEIMLPPLYLASPGGGCGPASTGGLVASSFGAPLDPKTFGVGTTQTLGTGRVRGSFIGTGPNEPITMLTGLTDTLRGEPCRIVLFDDGTSRCVGTSVAEAHYFADAGCTTPAVVHFPDPCDTTQQVPARGLVPSDQVACGELRASGVAALSEVAAPAFAGSPSACTAANLGSRAVVLVFDTPADLGEYPTVQVVMQGSSP